MTDLAKMIDSADAIEDAASLQERMQDDGYLFFSRLMDADHVLEVKAEIVAILREHHIVEDDGEADAMWSGGPQPTEAEYMAVYDRVVRLESYRELARAPEIVVVLESLCGEPVQVWEQKLIRLVYPDPEAVAAQGVGAHQDGDPKLGYKANRFYTGWIPLMEIDTKVGGLAVVPKSHKMGVLKSAGTVASSTNKVGVYGLDAGELTWASTEYSPGSAVIFANLTAHRGLPNSSDRIRLSCDFRYQPASESASWLAHTLGPDVRRTCQQIDEILAGRALFVTTGATPESLIEVRRRMVEEKITTLEGAQELVHEIEARRASGR